MDYQHHDPESSRISITLPNSGKSFSFRSPATSRLSLRTAQGGVWVGLARTLIVRRSLCSRQRTSNTRFLKCSRCKSESTILIFHLQHVSVQLCYKRGHASTRSAPRMSIRVKMIPNVRHQSSISINVTKALEHIFHF